MQELAGAVVLSRSGLTRLVDSLEKASFVERTECPSDRRGTFAAITPAGRAALAEAQPVHGRGIAEHFAAHVTPDELAVLGPVFKRLLAAQGVHDDDASCTGGP
jgi:DNA-binding MarR family transcriptional regulator